MDPKYQPIGEMNRITSAMKSHLDKMHKMLQQTENQDDLPEDAAEIRRLAMRAREYHRQVNNNMAVLVDNASTSPDERQQNSVASMEAQLQFEADVDAAWLLFKQWKPDLAQ